MLCFTPLNVSIIVFISEKQLSEALLNPMRKINRIGFFVIVLAIFSFTVLNVAAQGQLYRVKLIRAAPGDLLEVIEEIKSDIGNHADFGIQKPYLMRHSQGDQWDLLFIYPIKSLSKHFSKSAINKRKKSKTLGKKYGDSFFRKISTHQEAVFTGPTKKQFSKWFEEFSYYHVEIFTALAGKQKELLKQRKMENVYLKELKRRPNFIFTKVTGGQWDIFTIGFYKNLKDYASSGDHNTAKDREDAAKKAGFESTSTIGSYLREFLLEHHDTLAGAVRSN